MEHPAIKINKKQVFLWILYDFANSIAVVAFFLYFSQWLVTDNGLSDFWFNMIFAGSTLVLLIIGPVWGSISDKRQNRIKYLRLTTWLFFLALLITSCIALFAPQTRLYVGLAAIAYLLANFFYQQSFSFYNPLLIDLAPPERRGIISGIGQAANWLGQIAGILITLPFLDNGIHWIGRSGRAQTFLPALAAFFILSLPMMLLFKEQKTGRPEIGTSYKNEFKNYWQSFKNLWLLPGMSVFLLGYFFFNDAVLTATNNFPIVLEQVFRISDKNKSLLLLGILITSALGGLAGGWIADKIGLKKTLLSILSGWIIIFPVLAICPNFTFLLIFSIIMGALYGATWAVTRALMASLVPQGMENHAFSYYSLAERFATFAGPITWGVITSGFTYLGPVRYRLAMGSMTVFIIIGLIFAARIPKKNPAAENYGTVS